TFVINICFLSIIREIVRLRVTSLRDRSRDVAKGFPGYNKQTVVCLCTLGWDRKTNGRLFVYVGMGQKNKRSFVCVRWYGIEKQTVVCLCTLVWIDTYFIYYSCDL